LVDLVENAAIGEMDGLCLGPTTEIAIDGGQRQGGKVAPVRGKNSGIARPEEVAGFDLLGFFAVQEFQKCLRRFAAAFFVGGDIGATEGSARMERDG
jgi:hypothetical protein